MVIRYWMVGMIRLFFAPIQFVLIHQRCFLHVEMGNQSRFGERMNLFLEDS